MKHFLLIAFAILLYGKCFQLSAQNLPYSIPAPQKDTPTRLLRIYEDNDFLNIRGQGTDDAYTNGTRIELFYTKKKPSRFFLDRALPKAGDSSINIYGWGIMELMFTPDDITDSDYQPNDYPWSSALVATHTLYSYNPRKKYDFQTEVVAGVMGPAAFGEQIQTAVHRMIHYLRPKGWNNQYRNALLLNLNFTAEKQLASWGPNIEVIGGSQVFLGTMQNGVAFYPLIRIGKMTPYFNGFFSQYTGSRGHTESRRRNEWQAYFVIRPEGQLIFTNALLEGGLFTTNPNRKKGPGKEAQPYHDLHRLVGSVNYGAVVSSGHFGISFIQNTSSAMMKGLYDHEVGNLSVYYAW